MEPTINEPISPYHYRAYSDFKQLLDQKILLPEDGGNSASPSPYPVFSYKMQPAKHWKWGKAYPKRKSVTLFDVNEYNQLIQVKISIPQRADGKDVCPQLDTFEKYSPAALDMMYSDFLNVRMAKKDFDTKYALRNKNTAEILEYLEPYWKRPLRHPGYTIRHIWLMENEYRQHKVLFAFGYWENAWRLLDTAIDPDYNAVAEQLFQFLNSHPDYSPDLMEGQLFLCINFAEGLEEAILQKFASQKDKIRIIRDSLQIFVMLENLQKSTQSYFLTGKIHEFSAKLKEEFTDSFGLMDSTLRSRTPSIHKKDLLNLYYTFTHFLNEMIVEYPAERGFQKKAWQYLRVFSQISEQELTAQLFFKQYAVPLPFYIYELSTKLVSRYGFGAHRMAMLFKKHSVLDDRKIRRQSTMIQSSSSIIGQFQLTLPVISSMEYFTTYYEDIMDVIAQINDDIVSFYGERSRL